MDHNPTYATNEAGVIICLKCYEDINRCRCTNYDLESLTRNGPSFDSLFHTEPEEMSLMSPSSMATSTPPTDPTSQYMDPDHAYEVSPYGSQHPPQSSPPRSCSDPTNGYDKNPRDHTPVSRRRRSQQKRSFFGLSTPHENSPFRCDTCRNGFSLRKGLMRHIEEAVCQPRKERRVFRCTELGCDSTFPRYWNMEKHVATVHARCEKCEDRQYFKDGLTAQEHWKVAHKSTRKTPRKSNTD
ncbi:hypothetical protein CC80DRAFT_547308 [Byssothecium circinans]|uniref:C2H2-type domain-containing protein n=1 Tax=Byssothecium circinans TaxID=147558 RepID=A0A6A5TWZ8_9PLEO|nr:hypothetical protein CC80DRAFT_547308 [Byssothecium circinans]